MSEREPKQSIANLNDEFRRTTSKVLLTPSIQELEDALALIMVVRTFDDFTEDNDPYGEHDFGAIDWHGERAFWKIDYYDKTLTYGEDPPIPRLPAGYDTHA